VPSAVPERSMLRSTNRRTQEGHMDTAAMNIVILTLVSLSYLVTFVLGYGLRTYVYSHQRR